MKKRWFSLALALMMALSLAVPAFAAENGAPVGSYTVDLDKPDDAEMGADGEFTVRYLTSSRSYEEPNLRVDLTRTIPQGDSFTWTGLRASHTTYFRFFTDLDNDGTYDERLVIKESEKYVLAPYEEKYSVSLTHISGRPQPAGTFASMLEEMGGELSQDSSGVMTLAIPSDSLCQFFGGDTLFEWGIMRGGGSDVVAKGTMLFTAEEQTAEPVPEFTDVPEWCAQAVAWAAGKGVAQGTGGDKFTPGNPCTHEQILTFLYRAVRNKGAAAAEDMALALEWAREKGMIGDSFDPKDGCTRADAVSYIWQVKGSPEAEAAGSFTDVDADAAYAAAVSWAVETGIVEGYPDGGFQPGTVCSRGVIATMLHRTYVPEARLK